MPDPDRNQPLEAIEDQEPQRPCPGTSRPGGRVAGQRYNEGWYGANSSMTAVLGRMATYSGKLIKWDDAVASKLTQFPEALVVGSHGPGAKERRRRLPHSDPGHLCALLRVSL